MRFSVTRKVDELGRIVIPSDFREALHLQSGSRLEIYMEGERIVMKKPMRAQSAQILTEQLIQIIRDSAPEEKQSEILKHLCLVSGLLDQKE